MRLIYIACFTLLVSSSTFSATVQTLEEMQATAFMQRMYSHSENAFDAAEFNGKYLPDRQCALMEEFFLKNLILRPERSHGCDVGHVFIRYPGFSSEDFEDYGKPGQMPKPKLSPPKIEGDKANISAVSAFGKTIFFLTMTEKGWRVENALYYERVPTEVNVCHGQFLKEPTAAQLKYRPACKDY